MSDIYHFTLRVLPINLRIKFFFIRRVSVTTILVKVTQLMFTDRISIIKLQKTIEIFALIIFVLEF